MVRWDYLGAVVIYAFQKVTSFMKQQINLLVCEDFEDDLTLLK